jgi:hypothetical protein
MVTFHPVGRLGNFLFEAASALAYGWENKVRSSVPCQTNDAYWNPIYFPHLVHPDFNSEWPTVIVREEGFRHQKRPFDPSWRNTHNIVLHGYWQTEKYFKHHRQRILDAFALPWTPKFKLVSVHVRRGDYLTIKKGNKFKHPPVTPQWYREQMDKFGGKFHFLFFSDDIEWCRQEFKDNSLSLFEWPYKEIPIKDTRRELIDLVHMSCCSHHICSASTFSWWGMWLNQNMDKRVIFPKHWITPDWSNLDCSDVIPEWCERA